MFTVKLSFSISRSLVLQFKYAAMICKISATHDQTMIWMEWQTTVCELGKIISGVLVYKENREQNIEVVCIVHKQLYQ